MVERKMELKRRFHRKKKVKALKAKLGTAAGPDREKIIYKIKRLSPWWTEASLTQTKTSAATATQGERKSAPRAKAAGAGVKGAPRPKTDKK
jgi:hypothetical protein